MARVVWLREALRDVGEIRIYIRQHDPAAARDYAAALIEAGDSLEYFPQRGRAVGDGFRQLGPIRRNYLIRYRIEGAKVFITGVRHGARQD